VHFLSYKDMGGGISWVGVLCMDDFNQDGHWGGGYGVSASLNGQFSTTNPSLYWDILCFTHELGHNFRSPHTHCYMNIPNASDPPVDQCYNTQVGTNCWTGALCGTSGQPSCAGGTIMSYCHLRSGGYNNIVLYFGFSGQQSERVVNYMRSYVETRATSYPSCMPELLQLTANRNGTGSGTVTSSPAGITCGATCSALFAKDSSVTLTAVASGGSTFAGWSGSGCSGTGTCQVTMDAAKSATATFNIAASYTLTVSRSGGGTGTVGSSPTGIGCGGDCSESYSGGMVVTLTATPGGGSAFAGWSGACSGSGPGQVTMSASRSVTAWFSSATGCTTTVTNQAFTAAQLFQSCYSIVAGPTVSTTTAAGHLTLWAANRVVLRNGFWIGDDARLTIALDPSLAGT
jgi:hypothetical protein